MDQPRRLLDALFDAAIRAADPARCVPPHLPQPPRGRTLAIGAGKAAAAMARAVEDHWPKHVPEDETLDVQPCRFAFPSVNLIVHELEGLVVTRYGHAVACDTIEVVEAAHPVPDAAGQNAARRVLSMVANLSEDDLVLCLISGGGSALMAVPAPGLTLEDKQTVNHALLRSGATISEMNCVRKHLSAIKGGRLAVAAYPAPTHALLISDVPGDDPAIIASGPTIGDRTTSADAAAILLKYRIETPGRVRAHLASRSSETPDPGDDRLSRSTFTMVATPRMMLEATAAEARARGLAVHFLGDDLEGEARDLGAAHGRLAREIAARHGPVAPPALILSGGETTVTIKGTGRGGRNGEYALALALALQGHPRIHALACDTDGIDGSQDNAGAFVHPDTLVRAEALGHDAARFLADNDAYGFFESLGDLVITGPTRTNVNDFRAILVN